MTKKIFFVGGTACRRRLQAEQTERNEVIFDEKRASAQ